MEQIKVLLADDHQILTAGLKMTIDSWEEFCVVGIASNGKETVELCDRLKPNIVLMDMQMPVMTGYEATAIIKKNAPETHVIALTTFDDSDTVMHALKAGCDGFLLKVIDTEQLRSTLHSVMRGISVFDESALNQIRNRVEHKNSGEFSEREIEVLRMICLGYTNADIAEKLELRTGTVKNIVSLLLSKTCCISRADLTRYAIENELID